MTLELSSSSIENLLDYYPRRMLEVGEWLTISSDQVIPPITAIRERYREPIRLSFMGDFCAGKSFVINSILREEIAPTAVEPTTAIITYFRWGPTVQAVFHFQDGSRKETTLEYFRHLVRQGNHQEADQELISSIAFVEIFYPSDVLYEVTLVDTPGFGSVNEQHDEITRCHMRDADVVCWVFDAEKAGVASEVERIRAMASDFQTAFAVINKCDQKAPGDRPGIRDRILKLCHDAFEDALLYSAMDVLAVHQGSRPVLAEDQAHLCLDLPEEIRSRLGSRAAELRRQRAQRELEQLAKSHRDHVVKHRCALSEAIRFFQNDLPSEIQSAAEKWPKVYRPQRKDLQERLDGILRSHLGQLRNCFHYEEGGFLGLGTVATLDEERLQNVRVSMAQQLEKSFEDWSAMILSFLQEWAEAHNRAFEENKDNLEIKQSGDEIEPVANGTYNLYWALIPSRLVSQGLVFLLGSLHGFFETLGSLGGGENVVRFFARLPDKNLFDYLRAVLNVEWTLQIMDQMALTGSEDEPALVKGLLDDFSRIYGEKAAQLQARLSEASKLEDWLLEVERGQCPEPPQENGRKDDLRQLIEALKKRMG